MARLGDVAIEPFLVVPTSAPEPAAWALMVLGFGAAGTLIRRRRLHQKYS